MNCQKCLEDVKFVIPVYKQQYDEAGVETKVGLEYWCALCTTNTTDNDSIGVDVSDGKT